MSGERKRKYLSWGISLCLILAALVWHYALEPWGFYRAVSREEAALRLQTIAQAEKYLGLQESDRSHQQIIDLYNSHEPLAQDYRMQYTDSWCAAFVSAVAIGQELTDIIPTECGCQRQIGLWQEMGRWEESDRYIPQPGDLIYYDWDQTERGECTGWSDHVGMVVGVKWPFFRIIEGNKDDMVAYRVISANEITIRGFGIPDYSGKATGKSS